MGEVIAFKGAVDATVTVDPLMVEIATILWQFGGTASRDEVYARFALVRGRSAPSPTARDGFFADLEQRIAARSARCDAPIILAANDSDTWTLSPLARAILGPYPVSFG